MFRDHIVIEMDNKKYGMEFTVYVNDTIHLVEVVTWEELLASMPPSQDVIVDGRFTNEGISVSAYRDGRVLDEAWFTWAEVDDLMSDEESHFTFNL